MAFLSDRLGSRGVYTSLVLWHIYFVARIAVDIVHDRRFGFGFLFDLVLVGGFTMLVIAALTKRLQILGVKAWWAGPYYMFIAVLALVIRRARAMDITVALILWFVLQVPLILRRPRKTSGTTA